MRKWLAGILILLGLAGLALGWAGQTVWAPKEHHTAKASFESPGAAVVINPGVLYVGGQKGTVTIKSSGDYFMISASEGAVKEYLANSKYTAITGASNWSTLATSTENADKKEGTAGIQNSDLWTDVKTQKSGDSFKIEEWSKAELDPKKRQPYRAILLASDGDSSSITEVEITWPTNATNPWTPYAYAAGAVLLIIGLVLLLIAFNSRSRRDVELEEAIKDRPVLEEGKGESDASSAQAEATDDKEPASNKPREGGSRVAEAVVGTEDPAETAPGGEGDPVESNEPAAEGKPTEKTAPVAVPEADTEATEAGAPKAESTPDASSDTPVTIARRGRRRGTPDDVTDRLKALELDKAETSGKGVGARRGRRRADDSSATTTMTDPIATRIEDER
ncbi:hypothetical protein M3B90_02935 [Dermabacter sp. p3-SID358]|uniref:hypothetical protein n=1 Tax=Dermabacter sp. p3-SID358 TaxID=2916114 RepID=UPI0021A5B122|nr:hypothetical protein [Dermabacter sp. p3-SID358]MCT1866483.1 hypothetical protein [Dermabacter sp. p3-SID358]